MRQPQKSRKAPVGDAAAPGRARQDRKAAGKTVEDGGEIAAGGPGGKVHISRGKAHSQPVKIKHAKDYRNTLSNRLKILIEEVKALEEVERANNPPPKAELELKTEKHNRPLRKAFERPHPDLPADANVNRIRKIVSHTIDTALLEELNEQCRSLKVDRSAYIEAAIRAYMKPSP